MSTLSNTVRMSHKADPHTSKEAAAKVPTKKALLYEQILRLLEEGPATPAEVHDMYQFDRQDIPSLPAIDLYDIRRRMTELEHDLKRIEPIQVGVTRDGYLRYERREGQRVMRLVEETNK